MTAQEQINQIIAGIATEWASKNPEKVPTRREIEGKLKKVPGCEYLLHRLEEGWFCITAVDDSHFWLAAVAVELDTTVHEVKINRHLPTQTKNQIKSILGF